MLVGTLLYSYNRRQLITTMSTRERPEGPRDARDELLR